MRVKSARRGRKQANSPFAFPVDHVALRSHAKICTREMTIPAANATTASPAGPAIAPAFSATKNQEITGHRARSHRHDHPEIPDHGCDDRSMS